MHLYEILDSWSIWLKKELKENESVNLTKEDALELIDMFKEINEKLRGGETI